MKNIIKYTFDCLDVSQNEPLYSFLFKTFLKIIVLLTIVPIVCFATIIIEYNHYWAYKKDPKSHKIKGFYSEERSGSLIKMSHDGRCSCGRRGNSRSLIEILEKAISNSYLKI